MMMRIDSAHIAIERHGEETREASERERGEERAEGGLVRSIDAAREGRGSEGSETRGAIEMYRPLEGPVNRRDVPKWNGPLGNNHGSHVD